MPFHGEINAQYPNPCISKMKVGEVMYILSQELLVSRKFAAFHKRTQVFTNEEKEATEEYQVDWDQSSKSQFILIERIGPGFTENDFNIDVSGLRYMFSLISPGMEHTIELSGDEYLFFSEFDLIIHYDSECQIEGETPEQELERKSLELQDAIDSENYEVIPKLQNEVEALRLKINHSTD